jgi:hypothetical protein
MKAAWIGVLGAVVGALITIFGTEWVQGPKEGLFHIEYNAMTERDVDPSLRDQVTRFPVTLRISHVDGPAVEDISIRLEATTKFENLEVVEDDGTAQSELNGSILEVDVPVLRKGGTFQYRATSIGSPRISMDVTHRNGEQISQRSTTERDWYREDWFIVTAIMSALAVVVATSSYILRDELRAAAFGLPEMAIVGLAVAFSILPLGYGLVDAIILLLLFSMLKRLKKIETPTSENDGQ